MPISMRPFQRNAPKMTMPRSQHRRGEAYEAYLPSGTRGRYFPQPSGRWKLVKRHACPPARLVVNFRRARAPRQRSQPPLELPIRQLNWSIRVPCQRGACRRAKRPFDGLRNCSCNSSLAGRSEQSNSHGSAKGRSERPSRRRGQSGLAACAAGAANMVAPNAIRMAAIMVFMTVLLFGSRGSRVDG